MCDARTGVEADIELTYVSDSNVVHWADAEAVKQLFGDLKYSLDLSFSK